MTHVRSLRAPILLLGSICFVALALGANEAERIPEYKARSTASGAIVAWGEPPFEPLVEKWAQAFQLHHPNVTVQHFLKGSGTAVGALYTGVANVGFFGREITPVEIVTWKRIFPYEPLVFAIATGSFAAFAETVAPAVLVNIENPLDHISFRQLDAIYSYDRKRGSPTNFTKWGQLGLTGVWADRPITIYGLDPDTGTVQFLRTRVLQGGRWSYEPRLPTAAPQTRYRGSGRDASEALVDAIERDSAAIGIAGFRNLTPKLKALRVGETDDGPFVAGTTGTVRDRTYPLSRLVYLFVNKDPNKPWDPVVYEFVSFVLSTEGQEIIAKTGVYLPLPGALVQQERVRLN
jgi:phosphate transport system substrate-binding protein